MPDSKGKVVLAFGGGWATDFGPHFNGAPQGNSLSMPFLINADNVVYELDGGPHKTGGATKLNTTQVTESSAAVTFHGLTDVWFQGTAGAESQKQVAYVGTKILAGSLGDFSTSLKTGLENNKQPCFAIFNDKLYMTTTSLIDVPQQWNGSAGSTSAVGGTPPQFSIIRAHKNRMWAAGVASKPSRLYYSGSLDAEDWVGATSGSIDIDPNDGDYITGLESHKNELIVHKGPHRQSIHRITGSSPSGSDAFARVPFAKGVAAVNQNGMFAVNDDLVFPSPRGIHSLAATAAYGDYVEAFLARPILTYYQDELNHAVLNTCWGANYQAKGLGVWLFAKAGGTAKNVYLCYDYRFQPGRWASWGKNNTYLNANCLAIVQSSSSKHRLYAGLTTGHVYELDKADRVIDSSTAYTADVVTPYLNMGSSAVLKTCEEGYQSIQPKGSYDIAFGYTRDRNTEDSVTLTQTTGDTLG